MKIIRIVEQFGVILKSRKPANTVFAGFLDFFKSKIIDFSGEGGIGLRPSLGGGCKAKRIAGRFAPFHFCFSALLKQAWQGCKTNMPSYKGNSFCLRRGREQNHPQNTLLINHLKTAKYTRLRI
jgi:hypothetical protein